MCAVGRDTEGAEGTMRKEGEGQFSVCHVFIKPPSLEDLKAEIRNAILSITERQWSKVFMKFENQLE